VPALSLRGVAIALVVLGLAGASCGPKGPKLHPVRGKVLYLDKAPEGATIVFQPTGNPAPDAPKPSGVVAADGTFTLKTYPHGEGAPAGDYAVLITWLPPDARSLENPVNKLPARYADPSSPQLKATVKEGPNEIEPFKLTR
jgi:hypothetical protein